MSEPDPPLEILLLGASESASTQALRALGCTVRARPTRRSLVQDALQSVPTHLLLIAPASEIADWLELLTALPAPPGGWAGLCISAGAPSALRRRGLALGLQLWLDDPLPPEQLLAQLRWVGWQAQRLAGLQAQLDERKWTDKAKGLLMAAQSLDEAHAYQLLRDAAMHGRLRLGEVARAVVQAAQSAEAVNLAGQQRMLSQRLVKLMAQRASAIEPRRAKQLQDESEARIDANLVRLQTLLGGAQGAPLVTLADAWQVLRGLLTGKPTAAVLAQADEAAETVLQLSEQLTDAIVASGGRRPLRLVNVCGRQRMLSQRMAKEALLADLLPGRPSARAAQAAEGFEQGLRELDGAPLSSAEIRAALAEVREEWLRLLRSQREASGPEAAAILARSSELLLVQLDRLTQHYQQSLQLILG